VNSGAFKEHGAGFRSLLEQYLVHPARRASAEIDDAYEEQQYAVRKEVWRLVESGLVSRIEIIQAIQDLFSCESTWPVRCNLIQFMDMLEASIGHYPEFFFIVMGAEVLFQVDDVSDVATISRLLAYSGGPDVLRAYLVTVLLSGDLKKRPSAIETLKVAESSLQDDSDPMLLTILYLHAQLLPGPKGQPASLGEADRSYLREFFRRGLSTDDPKIVALCNDALDRLG
jgi:hypothetical protein